MVLAVLRHVADHPGSSRGEVVVAVSPKRPANGYQAVQRAERAGLIRTSASGRSFNEPPHRARQSLHPTAAGEEALAEAGQA